MAVGSTANLTVYYVPPGGIGSAVDLGTTVPEITPFWHSPSIAGHIFIELSDSATGVDKYFDFNPRDPNVKSLPWPVGPGWVNPSLDDGTRSDAESISIPLTAEQEQRVADAIDSHFLSGEPWVLSVNDCAVGVKSILEAAGIDVPEVPVLGPSGGVEGEVWPGLIFNYLMELNNENSPLLEGSVVRDNQSLPGNSVDTNF